MAGADSGQDSESLTHEFSVSAKASAQALLRILNFFAQLDVLPRQVCAEVSSDMIKVNLRVDGISANGARTVAEKIRSVPFVVSVDLSTVSSSFFGAV